VSNRRRFAAFAFLLMVSLMLLAGCSTTRIKESDSCFTFAVASDPHNRAGSWCNALLEIRDMRVNPAPEFPPAELFLVLGDFEEPARHCGQFKRLFADTGRPLPLFLPAMGTHDPHQKEEIFDLITGNPQARRHDAHSANYYLDYKNVRFIMVDVYFELGKDGMINQAGIDWVEKAITRAPSTINHVFVAVHPPAFPRDRHMGESLDENPATRNAFWRMLVRHQDRVRALFHGHTHYYYRMRVKDPESPAANDFNQYPDDPGGVWQISDGSVGRGSQNTVVFVLVDGKTLRFRVVGAEHGNDEPFRLIDHWDLQAPLRDEQERPR
jgi:3',5'-cyclic AMP phosphodiesterase CpdA